MAENKQTGGLTQGADEILLAVNRQILSSKSTAGIRPAECMAVLRSALQGRYHADQGPPR